jgi:hypothetical protein
VFSVFPQGPLVSQDGPCIMNLLTCKFMNSVCKHPVAYISSYIKNRRYATIYVITISLFSQHALALSGHHQVQLVETFTLHRNSKNLFY